MDSDIDRKVTDALGWQVYSNGGAANAQRKVGWARREGKLTHPFVVETWSGLAVCWEPETLPRPWRPSENPADALACLEAWCAKTWMRPGMELIVGATGGDYWCFNWWEDSVTQRGTFCEVICQAILSASEGRHD
jgi:hypothetical protein